MLDFISLFYLLRDWRSALPPIPAMQNMLAGVGSLCRSRSVRSWPKRRDRVATRL